jgi:IMP dehydrogenase
VDADLVIGSIVDAETALDYLRLGVDALKVGLGAGALCSIRLVAGVGAPQATALIKCRQAAAPFDVPVISDGGIRTSGDVVKALALGAESVMLGSLLAGCDESPGQVVRRDGALWKKVAGLKLNQIEIAPPTGYPRVDAYLQEHGVTRIEGGEGWTPAVGPCHWVLLRLLRGVRAGVHMAGARCVGELENKARLIRVSPSGAAESRIRV